MATVLKFIRPLFVTDRLDLYEELADKVVSLKEFPIKDYMIPRTIKILESEYGLKENIYDAIARDCEYNVSVYDSYSCTAAYLAKHFKGRRSILRDRVMATNVATAYSEIFKHTTSIYHGSEAAVALVDRTVNDKFVTFSSVSDEVKWAYSVASEMMVLQSPAAMQHPDGMDMILNNIVHESYQILSNAFSLFANAEFITTRSGSRHSYLAHLHYSGRRQKGFSDEDIISEQFRVNADKKLAAGVQVYKILGNTIILINTQAFILSHDDIISYNKMLRSYVNGSTYFAYRLHDGGCPVSFFMNVYKELFSLCVKYINSNVDYTRVMKAMNTYNMCLFNDLCEVNDSIGFKSRSSALKKEVNELCPEISVLILMIGKLAHNDFDLLNVIYVYHCVVGNDAAADELVKKMKASLDKPMETKYDEKYFDKFLDFLGSYMLCKFMVANRRIPNIGGVQITSDIPWVDSCLRGNFKMPPNADLGLTYIENEFEFKEYARYWYLDASDVTLILNDPDAYLKGSGYLPPENCNEILYTLKYGSSLSHNKTRTPSESINDLYSGVDRDVTVMLGASKNENTKLIVKKRITYAADHEFRKIQSMIDKNVQNALHMIPGSTIGLDYRSNEKKFRMICSKTILDGHTLNTSQDIDGWSESQERDKFMKFMKFALRSTSRPEASNIKQWWAVIRLIFNKMGSRFFQDMTDGGFQGMPVRQDTSEHAAIILYFIEHSRKTEIIPKDMKVLHSVCVDDAVASFTTSDRLVDPLFIFKHLQIHYAKLGYKIDLNKSIISYIKAIFCSRRFCKGIEIASDFKTILKMGVSYESLFKNPANVCSDYLGAALGALNANGKVLETYHMSLFLGMATTALYAPQVMTIPPDRAAVYAYTCKDDNGWGVPDIIQWSTKDVIDVRTRSNALFQASAECALTGMSQLGLTDAQAAVIGCIKSIEWETASSTAFFNDPFKATRKGPLKTEQIIKSSVRPYLIEAAESPEWKSLFAIEESQEYNRIIDLLCKGTVIDATIISTISKCMPVSLVRSLEAKAFASSVVITNIPQKIIFSLRKKINHFGSLELMYLEEYVFDSQFKLKADAIAKMNPHETTMNERRAFYTLNGWDVVNHTFPDPICTFTQVSSDLKSSISYSMKDFTVFRELPNHMNDIKTVRGAKGLYVPPKSNNVLEFTSKRFDSWDPITRKIISGMVILAAAEDEKHDISGLKTLFITSWDMYGVCDLSSPILPSIRGSLKRLPQNPGSLTHPIFSHRNISQSIKVAINSAVGALPPVNHMHDILGSTCALRAAATITTSYLLEQKQATFSWFIGCRADMIIHRSTEKMKTRFLIDPVYYARDNSSNAWGFVQSHPEVSDRLRILTIPALTAKYVTSMLCESKVDFDKLMSECKDIVKKEGEKRLFLIDAVYPPELKPRGVILPGSKNIVRDPLSVIMKPKPDHPSVLRDSYISQGVVPRMSVMTVGAASITDDRTLQNIIRTKLILEFRNLSTSSLAAASMNDAEFVKIVRPYIVDIDMWKSIAHLAKEVITHSKLNHLFSTVFSHMGAVGFRSDEDITAESLSSFAGKNVSKIAMFALPEYTRIVGGSKSAYEKKALLVTVTSNPETMNKRKRLLALRDSKKVYISQLKHRIAAIEARKVTHYGDNAAITYDGDHIPRLLFLRARLMIAQCCNFNDDLILDDHFFKHNLCRKLIKMQSNIIERTKAKIKPLPLDGIYFTIDNVEPVFSAVKKHLDSANIIHHFKDNLGKRCVDETLAWASADRQRELNTVYAISPGNISSKYTHIIESPVTALDKDEDIAAASYITIDDRDEAYKIVDYDDEENVELELLHKLDVGLTSGARHVHDSNLKITAHFEVERMEDVVMKVKGGWCNPEDLKEKEEEYEKAKIEKTNNDNNDSSSDELVSKTGMKITEYKKDLFTCLINDLFSVAYLTSLYPNAPVTLRELYLSIDVFNTSDEILRSKFGDVSSTLSFASAEWDDSYLTILDDEEDSDYAEDV